MTNPFSLVGTIPIYLDIEKTQMIGQINININRTIKTASFQINFFNEISEEILINNLNHIQTQYNNAMISFKEEGQALGWTFL